MKAYSEEGHRSCFHAEPSKFFSNFEIKDFHRQFVLKQFLSVWLRKTKRRKLWEAKGETGNIKKQLDINVLSWSFKSFLYFWEK